MKTFDILISEELAYKYRIKAKDKKKAMQLAMDKHELGESKEYSVDRCEICDCREVVK